MPLGVAAADDGSDRRGDLRGRRLGRLRRAARPGDRPRAAARDARQTASRASSSSTGRRERRGAGRSTSGPVGVEQSNTSIIFGDELIMKAIRRIEPGVNPELELLRFLRARGFPHIAALAGWYEVDGRHISATLGILQEFLAGARDGWDLALDELVTDPEGLLDRLEALGVVIGELHTALGCDNSRPGLRAGRAVERGAVDPLRRRRRADRAGLPRPARERGHGADPRPRAGRAREARRALARDRRRARDPHPRRPAPRPDDALRRAAGWCSTSRASRRGRCPSGA